MPCFSMLSSCSMLIACSEHCYLVLFMPCPTWYLLHFCHACLSLICCDLAVAQCSSFVKHLLYITAICFVVTLGCCSIVSWCLLSAIIAPWFIVVPLLVFLLCVKPGDEYVHEEPVEYANEDQAFVSSENLAGKMTIPSISLLSLFCELLALSLC